VKVVRRRQNMNVLKEKKDMKMVMYLIVGCNCKGGMTRVARLKVKE
jgi:hypothetical protein